MEGNLPPKFLNYAGAQFWPITAATSMLGSLPLLSTTLPLPSAIAVPVDIFVYAGGSVLFVIAALSSLFGMTMLLLLGLKPEAQLEVGRRRFSGMGMGFLLLFCYVPPWVFLMLLSPN